MTLGNLFMLYYDPEKNVASLRLIITLRSLIIAAGGILPEGGGQFIDATGKLLLRLVCCTSVWSTC